MKNEEKRVRVLDHIKKLNELRQRELDSYNNIDVWYNFLGNFKENHLEEYQTPPVLINNDDQEEVNAFLEKYRKYQKDKKELRLLDQAVAIIRTDLISDANFQAILSNETAITADTAIKITTPLSKNLLLDFINSIEIMLCDKWGKSLNKYYKSNIENLVLLNQALDSLTSDEWEKFISAIFESSLINVDIGNTSLNDKRKKELAHIQALKRESKRRRTLKSIFKIVSSMAEQLPHYYFEEEQKPLIFLDRIEKFIGILLKEDLDEKGFSDELLKLSFSFSIENELYKYYQQIKIKRSEHGKQLVSQAIFLLRYIVYRDHGSLLKSVPISGIEKKEIVALPASSRHPSQKSFSAQDSIQWLSSLKEAIYGLGVGVVYLNNVHCFSEQDFILLGATLKKILVKALKISIEDIKDFSDNQLQTLASSLSQMPIEKLILSERFTELTAEQLQAFNKGFLNDNKNITELCLAINHGWSSYTVDQFNALKELVKIMRVSKLTIINYGRTFYDNDEAELKEQVEKNIALCSLKYTLTRRFFCASNNNENNLNDLATGIYAETIDALVEKQKSQGVFEAEPEFNLYF